MNINPNKVIKDKIIIPTENTQVAQVGVDLTLKESIIIPPKSFVNTELAEQFNMKNCFGVITIRSSLSRKGIFLSCGIWDTGFKGIGGVSLYNMGNETITLEKGFRVCQMICYPSNHCQEYDGHYNKSDAISSQYELRRMKNG